MRRISKNIKSYLLWGGGMIILPLLIFMIANLIFPLPKQKLHPPPSILIEDRHGELIRAFTTPEGRWHIPQKLEQVSSTLELATLHYEDRWFYWHFGINPVSIGRAAIQNIKAGRIVMGGSTITMQVARMMEPKERTFWNKFIEAFRSLQLELRFSKSEILRFYFNLAPYGGNIVGSGAAARIYFEKAQHQLSLGEAALLAIIPNSPSQWRPDINPTACKNRRDLLLRQLKDAHKITEQQYQEAINESIPTKRHPMPFRAPHFARDLRKKHPHQTHFATTLDLKMQMLAENTLHEYLTPLQEKGINNGAVVIMDAANHQVRAMVGSNDFFDDDQEGQVNGAVSPRSPGSALKPFVYGLALHHGLITPETLLSDVPVDYSGYSPVNYDTQYSGTVTAKTALARSLNVPAVNLSAQLKENSVYNFLIEAGITTFEHPEHHYGLSLILGGCEVTLLELTNLYAGLANMGRFSPYQLSQDGGTGIEKQLLDVGACFILTEMLTEVRRPDLPTMWKSTVNKPKVAWKTGTSYEHKDAWSIGYSPKYAIGVWVGNFDGTGVAEIIGAEAAGPILFALFETLQQNETIEWFHVPDNVEKRRVCALSGLTPTKACGATKEDFYLKNITIQRSCNIHVLVDIDDRTGYRLCSSCRVGRLYHQEMFMEWPADVATWMKTSGYPVQEMPAHFPQCTTLIAGQGPIIRSPSAECEYIIREGVDVEYQKILLEASVSNRTQKIYWFLDHELIFSGSPEEKVFLTPVPGTHTLSCMDDEGRSTEMTLQIK